MELEKALTLFDRVEANLDRLEKAWEQMEELVPAGIVFPGSAPEDRKYEDLRRSFQDLTEALPEIAGSTINAQPLSLEAIAQGRFDAAEISEPEISISLSRERQAPAEQMAEYRFRFHKERRVVVRRRTEELVTEIDELLPALAARTERDSESVAEDAEWQRLTSAITEIQRLVGNDLVRKGRWGDLTRHLSFAQGVDLHDIAKFDWPSVRPDIETSLYGEFDPLPVEADDLAAIVAAQPTGPVSTGLRWEQLNPEGFERLIFMLLQQAKGYKNPKWLTKTNAPDRGRDLSADRVIDDPLAGTRIERVCIQCRHRHGSSLAPGECSDLLAKVGLWKPPFDVLIIATTGRFTSDAVQWIEDHNAKGERPLVETWPENQLEWMLASRGPLVEDFELRGG